MVAVELTEECLLIPAFTSGGAEVEEYKRVVFAALGLRGDQAWVEIDNAVHVRFFDGRRGNLATWALSAPIGGRTKNWLRTHQSAR